jgi:hypothetical protein
VSAGFIGYDPVRVLQLRSRVVAAIDALNAATSTDDVAADALAGARSARENLEGPCLSLLDRIIASDALLTWLTARGGFDVPEPALSPDEVSEAHRLAALARAVLSEEGHDDDDLAALEQALRAPAATARVLVGMFVALGGDLTAGLLVRLGEPSDDEDAQLVVATRVRGALAAASRRRDFPDAFGATLVDGFVDRLLDDFANPAAAMTFLLTDETFGAELLADVTRRMIDHERAAYPDGAGQVLWLPAYGSVLNRAFLDDGDEHRAPGWMRSEDPMYAVLGALSRDGDAGRALLTDDELARYLLTDRLYHYDGLQAVTAAAATAAAGPDVVPGAAEAILVDAAKVASAFVNFLGARPYLFEQPLHPDASTAAATILGVHLFAVHNAVLSPEPMDAPAGKTIAIPDKFRTGPAPRGAFFDESALDIVSNLAVRNDDGLATVRAALDVFQQQRAAVVSALLAKGALVRDSDVNEAMVNAGRLEAFFIERAGHQAEAIGRDKDEVISFFVDTATFGIGEINRKVGGVPVLSKVLSSAAGAAKEQLAGYEAAAARNAEEYARAAADQLLYVWYRELHAAGIVEPDLPAPALDGGMLVEWERYRQLPDDVRQTVEASLRESRGLPISAGAVIDAIKVAQLPTYQELE